MAMSPADLKSSAPRVLFLADCGAEAGGGHVMRCLSLVQALQARGAVCAMVATPAVVRVLDAFADERLVRLAAPEGPLHGLVEAAREAAGQWAPSVIVVDHYRLGALHELRLSGVAGAIAVIDDLADREHACRLLVDPTLGRAAQDYAPLTPPGTPVLTGPAYALLAPAYAQACGATLRARQAEARPRRLLVSLGLMDHGGITGRVLNLIQPEVGDLELDVVVGAGAKGLPWLRHLAGLDPRMRLHVDTREMASLIAAADIGVGAGGSSTWERATLGLPSISLILAENQRGLALGLDRRGASLAVDARREGFAASLPEAFGRLLGDGELRLRLSRTSAELCDGEGALRVSEAVTGL